jgi:DnaK suppressor protein
MFVATHATSHQRLTRIKHKPHLRAHDELIRKGAHMDAQHATAFKQKLEAQRADLLVQIAEQRGGKTSRAEVAAEHFAHNEDSDAQVNTARDLEFAINEHETAELAAIDEALARLSAGTYGHCIDCDAIIPEARLNAAPEAARCIGCQEKAEHNHH